MATTFGGEAQWHREMQEQRVGMDGFTATECPDAYDPMTRARLPRMDRTRHPRLPSPRRLTDAFRYSTTHHETHESFDQIGEAVCKSKRVRIQGRYKWNDMAWLLARLGKLSILDCSFLMIVKTVNMVPENGYKAAAG